MTSHQCFYVAVQGRFERRCPKEAEIVLHLPDAIFFCEKHAGVIAGEAASGLDQDDRGDEDGRAVRT